MYCHWSIVDLILLSFVLEEVSTPNLFIISDSSSLFDYVGLSAWLIIFLTFCLLAPLTEQQRDFILLGE